MLHEQQDTDFGVQYCKGHGMTTKLKYWSIGVVLYRFHVAGYELRVTGCGFLHFKAGKLAC